MGCASRPTATPPRSLIDRINEAFGQYARPADGIYPVDSRGTLKTDAGYQSDWDNELHPTSPGFGKIVKTKRLPVLRQADIAK